MKTYIGVDVSKLLLDVHKNGRAVQIPNTERAIGALLKSLPDDAMLVCESSGGYEALLVTQAHAAGRPIARINARQIRDFAKAKGRLAKTDTIDAEIITAFAQVFHPSPLSLPDPLQHELAGLAKVRSHIILQITQNNNLKETISIKPFSPSSPPPSRLSQSRKPKSRLSLPPRSNSPRPSPSESPASSKSRVSAL